MPCNVCGSYESFARDLFGHVSAMLCPPCYNDIEGKIIELPEYTEARELDIDSQPMLGLLAIKSDGMLKFGIVSPEFREDWKTIQRKRWEAVAKARPKVLEFIKPRPKDPTPEPEPPAQTAPEAPKTPPPAAKPTGRGKSTRKP